MPKQHSQRRATGDSPVLARGAGRLVRRLTVLATALALVAGTPVAGFAVESGKPVGNGPGAVVHTTDGSLHGTVTKDYRVFEGVPYAAPPGRWERPEAPTPWKGVRDATKPGNDCVQQAAFWRPGTTDSTTEDCLVLNVYTPRDLSEPKPVLVFFHGGGDRNGAATDADPWRMATWGDSIVISANYRLGVEGFLYLPQLDGETADGASGGNYGNLDKIEVLKWIQRNIESFGGDPDRVVIGGQSAGAEGVCFLLASPTAAGLFSGAALESALACGQGATKAAAATTGNRFVAAAGCAAATDVLACLRGKTTAEILAAQVAVGSRFLPVVGGSDLPVPTDTALSTGSFNRVPVLIGHTRQERRAFTYESFDMVGNPVTSAIYQAQVNSRYRTDAPAVLAEYASVAAVNPGIALSAVRTDEWACGHLSYAQWLSDWTPTWAFEFQDETSPLRSYMTVPSSFPIGAAHTSEVPYLWQSETAVPLDAVQLKTSRAMIESWAQFAAAGNPNSTGTAVWPQFGETESRIAFQAGGATAVLSGSSYAADHHCGLWTELATN